MWPTHCVAPTQHTGGSLQFREHEVIEELERRYVFRILADADFNSRFLSASSAVKGRLERYLEIPSGMAKAKEAQVLELIRSKLAMLEEQPPALGQSSLSHNLSSLRERLSLSETEAELVAFTVLLGAGRILRSLSKALDDLFEEEAIRVASIALRRPIAEVRLLLRPSARLMTSSLIVFDRGGSSPLAYWFQAQCALQEALLSEHDDGSMIFRGFFRTAPAPVLTTADYPHLLDHIKLMRAYFEDALAQRHPGYNILLYGPPGTGKTELVRAIASEIKVPLFEVSVERANGAAIEARARINAYRLTQALLAQSSSCLVMFDEIEDVFRSGLEESPRRAERRLEKGWMNRVLEENPVPAFWVTNSIDDIDEAFMRRFDLVLEIGIPPASVRKRLIETKTSGLNISKRWVGAASNCEHLTPANVERAVKVVRATADRYPDMDQEAAMEKIFDSRFRAQGRRFRLESDSVDYSLEYVNADVDIHLVLDGIKRSSGARVCLFGPPGTGKTAFGRFIAEELGRPLLVRRASDLVGMYVGETEHRIARAFARADDEGAVLLIDEADSFLRSREMAERSYEVRMVNEMLTQLENFRGVFVASTNLPELLDHATLRRFEYKIKLSSLNGKQVLGLLRKIAIAFGWTVSDAVAKDVARLMNLTPGDFSAVTRRLRSEPNATVERLVEGLKREVMFKDGYDRRSIGFTAVC